jgi:hypothetical protein
MNQTIGTGLSGIVAAALGAEVVVTDKAALLRLLRHNININAAHMAGGIGGTHVRAVARELLWGQPVDQLTNADSTYDTYKCRAPCSACDSPLPPASSSSVVSYKDEHSDEKKKEIVRRPPSTDITKLPPIELSSTPLHTRLAAPFKLIIGSDLTYDFEDLPLLLETAASLMGDHSHASQFILAYGEQRAAMPTFFEMASEYWDVQRVPKEHLDFSDIAFPTFAISICIFTVKKNPGVVVKDVPLPAHLFVPATTTTTTTTTAAATTTATST